MRSWKSRSGDRSRCQGDGQHPAKKLSRIRPRTDWATIHSANRSRANDEFAVFVLICFSKALRARYRKRTTRSDARHSESSRCGRGDSRIWPALQLQRRDRHNHGHLRVLSPVSERLNGSIVESFTSEVHWTIVHLPRRAARVSSRSSSSVMRKEISNRHRCKP